MFTHFTNVPVLIFDLDGTVRRSRKGALAHPHGDAGPPMTVDDVELFPGAENAIHKYVDETDCVVVGVTNQGHVGKGTLTVAESNAIQDATRAAFKVDPFHMVLASYAYHNATGVASPWNRRSLLRKPYYGMLAAIEVSAEEHGIALDWDHPATVMVGDWTTDSGCALAAGIRFQWAWEFFGRPLPGRNGPALEGLDLVRARVGWMLHEAVPTALRGMGAEKQACDFEGFALARYGSDEINTAHAAVSALWGPITPASLPFAMLDPVPSALISARTCAETLDRAKSMLFWLSCYHVDEAEVLKQSQRIVAMTVKSLAMVPPAGLT